MAQQAVLSVKNSPIWVISTPILLLITLTENWYPLFQIYTGRHVAPINRENLVEQVDYFLDIQREVASSMPSKNMEPWTDVFPKECIILHFTRRHLMAKYTSLRNAANNSQSSAVVHVWRILAFWWQHHLVPMSK